MSTAAVEAGDVSGTDYEAVIGLEVHVELATASKMFCGCSTDFGAPPNTRVCPVCLGQPGTLPVVNRAAVESAMRLGLALGCDISASQFHRKHYFYPDMPKNYQISQYDVPICAGGALEVPAGQDGNAPVRVGITRVHMEEDTGKSLHVGGTGRIHGADESLVDYNRAGIPLLEIVSEPDLATPEQARAYLAELRAVVLALGVSDAKLEEGSMRCDANISVNRPGQPPGTRCEIKNLNSLRSLGRALRYEIDRQIQLREAGQAVVQQTRHWDEAGGATSLLRSKEATEDYRYFPDPDLVPIEPDAAWIDRLAATLPELPAAARQRLVAAGVPADAAGVVVAAHATGVFDDALAAGAGPGEAAKWLANDVTGALGERGLELGEAPLTGAHLAELLAMVDEGVLSTKLARQVLEGVLDGQGSPRDIAAAHGLEQISDTHELEAVVEQVIAENADAAAKVAEGNDKAIGALVGGVMKATGGQANPQVVNQLLRERLQQA